MRRRAAALIVLILTAAALPADPPPKPREQGLIDRAPEFVRRVDDAIARGVSWLKAEQDADGSFDDYGGYPGATTALAYHTLRVCGVTRDDPSAQKAWDALKRNYRVQDLRTYSAALYLMAIETHGDAVAMPTDGRDVRLTADDARWAREIAGCLAGGQGPGGGWSYLVGRPPEGKGYAGRAGKSGRADDRFDHSNTQYALLGLKSAARCGVPIDPSVWKEALLHFLGAQEETGADVQRRPAGAPDGARRKGTTSAPVSDRARGWSYVSSSGRGDAYASMTAAGVSSVVICRSELEGTSAMTPKLWAESERSVWDGLAWLGTRWTPVVALGRAGRGAGGGAALGVHPNYYEYYGVERAGMLAGVEWMADLDWYGAGAGPILAAQAKGGGWSGQYGGGPKASRVGGADRMGDVIDTCFALLFLKKGTIPVRRGAVTQVGGDDDINFGAAASLTGRDFEDFVDLVLSRWRQAGDAGVKRRLFEGATTAGAKLVEPLIVRMDSSDPEERAAAHALLGHATGLDFGYLPGGAPEAREVSVAEWQTWWLRAKSRIAYDAAAKRLVVR